MGVGVVAIIAAIVGSPIIVILTPCSSKVRSNTSGHALSRKSSSWYSFANPGLIATGDPSRKTTRLGSFESAYPRPASSPRSPIVRSASSTFHLAKSTTPT
jgi:hypothetical protein